MGEPNRDKSPDCSRINWGKIGLLATKLNIYFPKLILGQASELCVVLAGRDLINWREKRIPSSLTHTASFKEEEQYYKSDRGGSISSWCLTLLHARSLLCTFVNTQFLACVRHENGERANFRRNPRWRLDDREWLTSHEVGQLYQSLLFKPHFCLLHCQHRRYKEKIVNRDLFRLLLCNLWSYLVKLIRRCEFSAFPIIIKKI